MAPRSPDVETFERNLETASSWLAPFDGFGPSHFMVGEPEFDFEDYRPWIAARFEPRKFSQLDAKCGRTLKFAIGAFIQALGQNPGLERELQELGERAHVYAGTCLGDYELEHETSLRYERAQRRWNRFWCRPEHNSALVEYRAAALEERAALRKELGAPDDPSDRDPEEADYDQVLDRWLSFWVGHSEGLRRYLEELRPIEAEGIRGEVESEKGHMIRRKAAARRKLNARWGCPPEPWSSVSPEILWNIPNIPAAQISMLGRITGPALAPVAACSGFGSALKLAQNAIRLGEAKVCVVGAADPAPHPLLVGAFYGARVISHDGQVSKPFTEMRGTHISGGACVWIVGDFDYLTARGMKPLGLEILGVGLTSDADHIITPSADGPRRAMRSALADAGVEPADVATWDMHATATPGDWPELQTVLEVFGGAPLLTARKGSFGHGMSVCGGWELTAQHLSVAKGVLHPIDVDADELHPGVRPHHACVVQREGTPITGGVAGKINMGVGGINACVISRRWGQPS